jgi:hypothetical protein
MFMLAYVKAEMRVEMPGANSWLLFVATVLERNG